MAHYSNTTLVKVKLKTHKLFLTLIKIQIQHLLKLNLVTTASIFSPRVTYSNTTLVKVKLTSRLNTKSTVSIQIQHLLKLNDITLNNIKNTFLFKYNTC